MAIVSAIFIGWHAIPTFSCDQPVEDYPASVELKDGKRIDAYMVVEGCFGPSDHRIKLKLLSEKGDELSSTDFHLTHRVDLYLHADGCVSAYSGGRPVLTCRERPLISSDDACRTLSYGSVLDESAYDEASSIKIMTVDKGHLGAFTIALAGAAKRRFMFLRARFDPECQQAG